MNKTQNNNDFMPDSSYLEKYRSTRKSERITNGITIPGLYSTAGYLKDKSAVIFVAFIEIIAMVITIKGGGEHGQLLYAVAIATIFIVFDVVGAMLVHHDKERKTKDRNYAAVALNPNEREGYLNSAKQTTGREIFGGLLIVMSALLKFLGIILFGGISLLVIRLLIALYIITIYIHIFHTGYFLAELNRKRLYKKQIFKYYENARQINAGLMDTNPFQAREVISALQVSKIKLNTINNEIIAGNHKIVLENQNEDEYEYKIISKGLLEDKDIMNLIQNQREEQIKFIIRLCIQHQLNF